MTRKDRKRIMTGVAGAALMLNGCAAVPEAVEKQEAATVSKIAAEQNVAVEENNSVIASVKELKEADYVQIANVSGIFAFDQNVTTPGDEVFNIFGTAMTGICAKPGFVIGEESAVTEDYYINVSGTMKHAYQVNLNDLKEKETTKVMSCSCATGSAVVNAEVMGVPVSEILNLDDLAEGTNTITFQSADGYGMSMPLSYVLEKEALIAYQIGGQNLPDNQRTQVWMPETVAKYFTRNVVNIQLSIEDEVPAVDNAEEAYQAKVNILNDAMAQFHVGDEIRFEGYADDCGNPIAAIEFSLDGGQTWTTYETTGATSDKWVYWYFTYTPETTGIYELQTRAVTQSGTVSPVASTLVFTVTNNDM